VEYSGPVHGNLTAASFTAPVSPPLFRRPVSPPPSPPPPVAGSHPISELGAYRSSNGSWSLDSDTTSLTFVPTDQSSMTSARRGCRVPGLDRQRHRRRRRLQPATGVWISISTITVFSFPRHVPVRPGRRSAGRRRLERQSRRPGRTRRLPRQPQRQRFRHFHSDIDNHRMIDSSCETFTFGLATDHVIVGDWNAPHHRSCVFRDAPPTFLPTRATSSSPSTATAIAPPSRLRFGLITDTV